jgi:AraC family transcriptional regulator, regulatory protein of adaptative response / methylated-DNA-[protein]-cysteine methyltransferase
MNAIARCHDVTSDYDRIAQAIEFLDTRRTQQTGLQEIADAVGLSPFHFQRLFTRWVGVSPKRFSEYLTLDMARDLLHRSRSIMETALDLGLSGPSRLHDLFVTIDAVTPGEHKSGGERLQIDFGWHASPFGRCLIGTTPRGICWLSFADVGPAARGLAELKATWPAAVVQENAAVTEPLAAQIFGLPAARGQTPLRLALRGTNFQVKVWEALLRIPPGCVATYADVGRAIDRPRAARAIGQAVGANPIAYLIPCHRVIRSLGLFGGYRWGTTRKRAMLGWEAARYDQADDSGGAPPAARVAQ